MIASLISKCEFRTFIKGIPEKKGEYYLWNYEPNQNQNAGDFWQQFVTNLLYDNAALIVEVGGKLYVADSFHTDALQLPRRRFQQHHDRRSDHAKIHVVA